MGPPFVVLLRGVCCCSAREMCCRLRLAVCTSATSAPQLARVGPETAAARIGARSAADGVGGGLKPGVQEPEWTCLTAARPQNAAWQALDATRAYTAKI
ncbi:MAG: hypothetical protein EOO65_03415 [Methanosarcinales archaeon]|nr:MAG: hypothetical protein EOO65_03415 [Methanosarcinales archaeon]